jgi:DNA-binding MarR family transcriptional regulator
VAARSLGVQGQEDVSERDAAAILDQIVEEVLPARRGFAAWQALLQAHATLMRRLATELVEETGLTLGDFDVLVQLASAGGVLRMTDLAARVFSSRSNLTRRIDRLVTEGLVQRTSSVADGRGVVVSLTEAGMTRLRETAPVHLRGVADLFIAPLTDEELAVLERALEKVTADCTFG